MVRFRRQRDDAQTSINLTPLIDVVFLLLIFFMVTTTFTKETRLQIDLPQSSSQAVVPEGDAIELLVDAKGSISINGQTLLKTDFDSVKVGLERSVQGQRNPTLVITADAKAPFQSVVYAMDAAGRLGISRQNITTRQFQAQ